MKTIFSAGFLFAVLWSSLASAQTSIVGYAGVPATGAGVSSLSVPYSPGSQSGDIVFAYVGTASTPAVTVTTPAGWTLLAGPITPVTGVNSYLFQYISGGLDPSNFVFNFSGSVTSTSYASQITYRGVNNATPVDGSVTTASQTSGTSLVLPAVSPTGAADLLVASVQDYGGFSGVAISGMTFQNNQGGFPFFDQQLSASGTTGTRTATGLNSSLSTGFLFALLPATLPTPTPTATPTPVPAIAASCPAGQFVTQISPTICESNGVVAETIVIDKTISHLAPTSQTPSAVPGTTNKWVCLNGNGTSLQWDLTSMLPTNTLYLREAEVNISLSRGGAADIAWELYNSGGPIAEGGEDHYADRTGGMPARTDKAVYFSYVAVPQAASRRLVLNANCHGVLWGNMPVITLNLNLKANIGN